MFWYVLILGVSVVASEISNFSNPKIEKFSYNSSDLSYFKNGIQFLVSENEIRDLSREDANVNISEIQWITRLYDHHKWWNNLVRIDISECKRDMITYLEELRNGTSWAVKSEY